jgi:hypothetical protein
MSIADFSAVHQRLAGLELPLASSAAVADAVRILIAEGIATLPLPAAGQTSKRWRVLTQVGAIDLSLAKIFESHADALAILAELDTPADLAQLHAVWAAENPREPLDIDQSLLVGTKSWCSGATDVDVGLLTATNSHGDLVLVRVTMDHPSITRQPTTWRSPAMAASGTTAIRFDGTPAEVIGPPEAYLERPGFWHGGAGIAAVWLGAATALARRLAAGLIDRVDPHALAHLGRVDATLAAARALLDATAAWIDAHPSDDAFLPTLRLRLAVESAAHTVLHHTALALGPGPLTTEPEFIQRRADLELFLRQSHAERDLADLGDAVRDGGSPLP